MFKQNMGLRGRERDAGTQARSQSGFQLKWNEKLLEGFSRGAIWSHLHSWKIIQVYVRKISCKTERLKARASVRMRLHNSGQRGGFDEPVPVKRVLAQCPAHCERRTPVISLRVLSLKITPHTRNHYKLGSAHTCQQHEFKIAMFYIQWYEKMLTIHWKGFF